jgi:hypothetical protein
VDVDGEGALPMEGILQVFAALGQRLTLDDAHLLMRQAQVGYDQPAGGDLLVTRDQLLDLFEVPPCLHLPCHSSASHAI